MARPLDIQVDLSAKAKITSDGFSATALTGCSTRPTTSGPTRIVEGLDEAILDFEIARAHFETVFAKYLDRSPPVAEVTSK